ncbi:MAG: ABC transporter ATP-binding protein [Bdellovibrionales bacterium]|nr:ABC transporter ATP-binding protein [Bdellovibrionales bacterium]
MTENPAVRIENLVKIYAGDVNALQGISFNIPKGSFFGLLGANGAGKTTTIKILTGLCNKTSGNVEVFGKNLSKEYLACRRLIGVAPQEFNFDRFFPLSKILEFQGGYFGLPASIARKRAEELLKQFGLWEKRHQKSSMLSGGMKRRLLLVKALMHDPEILILDEPTAGVDVELRHEFWRFLKEWNQKGKTIILTTHYLEEAEKLCSEVAIIHEGRLVKHAPTGDILKDYATLEEAFLSQTGAKPYKSMAI